MSDHLPYLEKYSPALLSILPMLYAAWSDTVLSPSEVKYLRQKVATLNFLNKQEAKLIAEWSNPKNPPSRQLFLHWEKILVQAGKKMSWKSRKSLVDLGLEMARKNARSNYVSEWKNAEVRAALEDLEERLNLVNWDTYKRIFPIKKLPQEAHNFDLNQMAALLEGDTAAIRKKVKRLLEDPAFHYRPLRTKSAYRKQVLEWCKLLAEQGYGAWAFPKEYGGRDNMADYIAIFETMGYFDLSMTIKFGVQFGLFGGSVYWLGTKKHRDKYLKAIGLLDLPGCFAMTETGHGSNVRGLETTATYDSSSDEIIVHSPNFESGKEFIGNALHSKMATVFAQLIVKGVNHGVHAVLVPLRDKNHKTLSGIKVRDNGYKMGLNGIDNGRIWFNQVRVPRENLLDNFGAIDKSGTYSSPIANPSKRFFTMLGTLVGGRVCVPKAGLSAAKSGLTIAIKYALKRRQFGPDFKKPETLLLDYPTHQRRLMPLLAKAYALNFGLNYLAERYVNRSEKDIREIETLAAGFKSYATWFTTETLQACREACGGKGYLAENRFAALKADSDIFTTFEGDNTVLMQLVAKGVLSEFKANFHAEGMVGVLRFVGGMVSTAILEKNPFTIRRTDEEHLRNNEMHLDAFCYRQKSLAYSVGQEMRAQIKQGLSAYDAFIKCQSKLLPLAEAYIELHILEQFHKVIATNKDASLTKALGDLCDLYALSTIEKHKGWYLEENYMEGSKTKAITELVDKLCAILREDALALVEAFAIPDALLAAPIAIK